MLTSPPSESESQSFLPGAFLFGQQNVQTPNSTLIQAAKLAYPAAANNSTTVTVKIDAHDLPALPWGHYQQLQTDEIKMAIGNSFELIWDIGKGENPSVGSGFSMI